jgi:DNA-binding NtrC family response regulator
MAVVAIFNSSDDTVEILRLILEHAGHETVAGHVPDIKRGRTDLLAFVAEHQPDVIVYDIAPPLEENWRFLRLVQDLRAVESCGWVITTTNKEALEEMVGPTGAFQLLGKPLDLEQIVSAVRKAADDPSRRKKRA